MKIRNQLKIIAFSPVVVMLILAISVYLGEKRLEEQRTIALIVDTLEKNIEQFEASTQEYYLRSASRPLELSRIYAEKTEQQLAQANLVFDSPKSVEMLDDIAIRFKQAQWSFNEYIEMQKLDLNRIQQEYAKDLIYQMGIAISSIKPMLHDLHGDAHKQIQEYNNDVFVTILSTMIVLALISLVLISPVLYRIDTGVNALTRATRNISDQGKLERKIELSGKDEFSQLAADFNKMFDQLSSAEKAKQKHLNELVTAVKDLEAFSYSVSHDLRSPLRAIDGFVSILKEDYADRLDEEGLRLFGIVQENANKMGRLIDDILAFSRAGRFELQKDTINMQQLVSEVWEDVLLENPGISIEFRLEEIPSIQADVNAMRQVWHNLLSNAVKFCRGKNPAIIEIGFEKSRDQVRYFVKDNGVGFNTEYKDKLFVMFQRLHGMDEYEGTGIGLAIVKRFIQKHNGTVDADAQLNQGAVFSFTLPVADNTSREQKTNG